MSIINPSANNHIKSLYPKGKPRQISFLETFIISAISPAIAVLFTNPFDTAKVRLQLQGQLSGSIRYKNSFDALKKIMANEGIPGLQKGLVPAVLREASKNFFRIVCVLFYYTRLLPS
jgi:Mitochondrial carrier protein